MKPVQWQDEIERLSRDIDFATLRQALEQADIRAIGSGATNDPFKPQCHLQGRAWREQKHPLWRGVGGSTRERR